MRVSKPPLKRNSTDLWQAVIKMVTIFPTSNFFSRVILILWKFLCRNRCCLLPKKLKNVYLIWFTIMFETPLKRLAFFKAHEDKFHALLKSKDSLKYSAINKFITPYFKKNIYKQNLRFIFQKLHSPPQSSFSSVEKEIIKIFLQSYPGILVWKMLLR